MTKNMHIPNLQENVLINKIFKALTSVQQDINAYKELTNGVAWR